MFRSPGTRALSAISTFAPFRARVSAAADPAGPAPTTMTSKSRGTSGPGDRCGQPGELFVEVPDDRVMGYLEYGGVRVDVDGHYLPRVLHPDPVLKRTADPHPEVDLRPHCRPCLSDLAGLTDQPF